MNFLYDLIASQANNDGAFHGGGKFAKRVFLAIFGSELADITAYAVYDSSKKLDEDIFKLAKKNQVTLLDIKGVSLPDIVVEFSIDRIYSALPFGLMRHGLYDVFKTSCKVFCTIHGLRNLEARVGFDALQYYSFGDFKGRLRTLAKILGGARVATRDVERYNNLFRNCIVYTVSNHTKYAIMSYMPELKQRIRVFYSPDVSDFSKGQSDETTQNFELGNYFLLISGNRWLKNNLRSAQALDNLFSERPDMTQNVVVTGVSDPQIFLRKIKNKSRFVFYDYVSEQFLKVLYEKAFAFVYMTLNEGFGYPPLDAMKTGKPVITSPLTSIPEICGDAVLYANPYSVEEIKNRILQLEDQEVYQRFVEAGLQRYELIQRQQEEDLKDMVDSLMDAGQYSPENKKGDPARIS